MPAPFTRSLAAAALVCVLAVPAHAQPVVRLPAADRALTGRPTQVFSVGRAEGRDTETFARVAQVAFDPAGNLYVLDQGRGRVVVFDRQGAFVRQFGRPGRGPGEFLAPMQLVVAPDGAVIVSDLGRRAYSVFGPDGTYRTSVPFATRTGVEVLSRLERLSSDRFNRLLAIMQILPGPEAHELCVHLGVRARRVVVLAEGEQRGEVGEVLANQHGPARNRPREQVGQRLVLDLVGHQRRAVEHAQHRHDGHRRVQPRDLRRAGGHDLPSRMSAFRSQVDDVIRAMIDTPRPVICDVVVDRAENVYPMIPGGKGITEMILYEDL